MLNACSVLQFVRVFVLKCVYNNVILIMPNFDITIQCSFVAAIRNSLLPSHNVTLSGSAIVCHCRSLSLASAIMHALSILLHVTKYLSAYVIRFDPRLVGGMQGISLTRQVFVCLVKYHVQSRM